MTGSSALSSRRSECHRERDGERVVVHQQGVLADPKAGVATGSAEVWRDLSQPLDGLRQTQLALAGAQFRDVGRRDVASCPAEAWPGVERMSQPGPEEREGADCLGVRAGPGDGVQVSLDSTDQPVLASAHGTILADSPGPRLPTASDEGRIGR